MSGTEIKRPNLNSLKPDPIEIFLELQIFDFVTFPPLPLLDDSFVVTIFKKGDLLKNTVATRNANCITVKKSYLSNTCIEESILEFINNSIIVYFDHNVFQNTLASQKFIRIHLPCRSNDSILDFKLANNILRKISDFGLSLDFWFK
jgi:hypothetical protein